MTKSKVPTTKDSPIPVSIEWANVPASGPLLRPSKAAQYLGLSRSTLYAMVAEGQFPAFIKLSERASAVPMSWIQAFVTHRASASQSGQ